MINFNFTGVDGSGFQLKDLTGAGIFGSTNPDEADQVQIWNPQTSGYENWYYYFDESDHSWDGWYDLITQSSLFEEVHPEGLANGSAAWYLSANGSTGGAASIAGAVDSAKTVTFSMTKGNYNMIGNPYPVGLQLDNADQVTWENACGSTNPDEADQVQIWNPQTSGYENWYYYVDESDHSWDGWYDLITQSSLFEEVHPNGLDAGVPVWYLSKAAIGGTFDVTFKTPMK